MPQLQIHDLKKRFRQKILIQNMQDSDLRAKLRVRISTNESSRDPDLSIQVVHGPVVRDNPKIDIEMDGRRRVYVTIISDPPKIVMRRLATWHVNIFGSKHALENIIIERRIESLATSIFGMAVGRPGWIRMFMGSETEKYIVGRRPIRVGRFFLGLLPFACMCIVLWLAHTAIVKSIIGPSLANAIDAHSTWIFLSMIFSLFVGMMLSRAFVNKEESPLLQGYRGYEKSATFSRHKEGSLGPVSRGAWHAARLMRFTYATRFFFGFSYTKPHVPAEPPAPHLACRNPADPRRLRAGRDRSRRRERGRGLQ
ncbi:hypothetical protein ACNOYE_19975 [Nannocystaceae bacterium ST9]